MKLWHNPNLRRLWLSEVVSIFGSWFTSVAVMTAVYTQFKSPWLVAVVGIVGAVPSLALNAWIARIIRRDNAKKVMVVSDIARAALVLGAWWVGGSVACYVALVAGVAVFNLAFRVARAVYLPGIVKPEDLAGANSGFGVAWGVMSALGAALGGYIVSVFGAQAALMLDAITFVVSALLLYGLGAPLPAPDAPPQGDSAGAGSMWQTAAYVWSQRQIRTVVLAGVSWGIVGGGLSVLLPIYGSEIDGNGQGIGLFYGIQAAGFFIGSLLVGFAGKLTPPQMLKRFIAAYVLQALSFCLFAMRPTPGFEVAGLFATRLFGGAISSLDSSLLQLLTPAHLLSRVCSLHYAVFGTVMPLSMALTGLACELYGVKWVSTAIALWGVASALQILFALRSEPLSLRPWRS